jgi:hypothetical protein
MKSLSVYWRISGGIALLVGLPVFASADTDAWVEDGSSNFELLDLDTGDTTLIGNMGQTLSGLANLGGVIYGTSYFTSPELFSIDTSTGALDPIAALQYGTAQFGSTTSGLYGLTYVNNDWDLVEIDPNGDETLIGDTGITTLGNYAGNMSSDGTNLYVAAQLSSTDEELYELNTTTGAATDLGDLSGAFGIDAMTFVDGTMYSGGYFPPFAVDTVDLSTMTATNISNAQNVNSFWGLAPVSNPAPGPAAAIPFVTALIARRRRSIAC